MKNTYIKYSAVAMMAALCFSCSSDDFGGGNAEGNTVITLDVMDAAQTRSGESIETSAQDKKISNVWLVQYVYNSKGEEIEADRAIRYATISGNKLSTSLRTTLEGETTKIYFLANTHDDEVFDRLNPPSEETVKQTSMAIDYNTISEGLPMSGELSLSSFADGDAITAKLQRRVAKVVVNVSTPTSTTNDIELLDVQFQNTKSKLYFFDDSNSTIENVESQDFDSELWGNNTTGKNTYTYYIPASYAEKSDGFPYFYIHAVTNDKFVTYRLRLQGEGSESSNDESWRKVENNHYYIMNANITGANNVGTTDSNVYIQSTACNLVDHGDSPENCYMINVDDTAAYYRFPVSQINIYRQQYDSSHLITNDTTYHAKVIWWSTGSQDADAQTNSWISVIGATCHGNDGYVVIKRKDIGKDAVSGNALVGVFNDKEELLWSWHIWQTPETDDLTIDGNTFMAMNLGATEYAPNVNRAYEFYNATGLYYQWGRKDPFGSSYENNTGSANLNYVLDDYQFSIEDFSSRGITTPADNIIASRNAAVKNPTIFYYNSTPDEDVNWSGCNGNNSWLYKTEKSVFDPCPFGYRVPTADELAVLASEKYTSGGGRTVIGYGTNFYVPVAAWLTGVGVATSIGVVPGIDYTNNGATLYSSTSATGQQNAKYLLLKGQGGNDTNAYGARTYARPIRPIKIK